MIDTAMPVMNPDITGTDTKDANRPIFSNEKRTSHKPVKSETKGTIVKASWL